MPDFTQTGSVSPIPVPIAAGTSASSDVPLGGAYVVAILVPAAWTAAVITFDAADSSGTWYPIRNADDSEYVVPAVAGQYIEVDSGMFPGVSNLRVRSGTAVAPVVQVSAVSPILMVSPKGSSSRGGAATVADGANMVEGSTADVKVQGDSAGTISAKLRGLNTTAALLATAAKQDTNHTDLAAILAALVEGGELDIDLDAIVAALAKGQGTAAASFSVVVASDQGTLNVQGQAGENHLGEVAGHLTHGKQVIPARPANTTAYAANQAYNIAPLTVTAATNANPSVVTVAAHGLVNGQAVNISGAVGNTAINGTWLVANVTANTFTLTDIAGAAVAGNGVWASGGSLILLLTFPGISRLASARGYITKGKLALDGVAMTGRWRLWLYNILVTPLADQATFTTLKANNAGRIGYIDFSPVTGGSGSDCTFGLFPGASGQAVLEYTADANSAIYGILQSLDASTPISGGTAIVELSGEAY